MGMDCKLVYGIVSYALKVEAVPMSETSVPSSYSYCYIWVFSVPSQSDSIYCEGKTELEFAFSA